MTPQDLQRFLNRHKLTVVEASYHLDRSPPAIYQYLRGVKQVPEWMALLCESYDRGFLPVRGGK